MTLTICCNIYVNFREMAQLPTKWFLRPYVYTVRSKSVLLFVFYQKVNIITYLRITSYYSIYWFKFRNFVLKEKNRQLLEPLCNLIRRLYIDKDKKFPFFNFWNGSLARTILWWILWTFLECLGDLSPNHRLFKHIEARSGWVCSWM